MLKHTGYSITFQEVPNEIALVFPISGCTRHCDGCHSPWLQTDIGDNLEDDFHYIVGKYIGEITCVCFMGGDDVDPETLARLIKAALLYGLKTCVYSGAPYETACTEVFRHLERGDLTYLKTGPYIRELGGLASSTTNQHMYRWNPKRNYYEDITSWFWRKRV